MKKILLSLLAFGFLSFSSADCTIEKSTPKNITEVTACNYGQCRATAKSTGNQCKHCVSNSGDSFCWQHK
ncbi:hypothetical protein [Flavobacterium ovatum]|uniref:hypothetical protein n=1 Tax=Flavobacterium ovatum TaxID=1928857 RepID=UPI003450992E